MNLVLRNTALSAAISLSLLGTARAEDAKTIDNVVVTANRIEQPIEQTLASVTVITRADIETSQAPDLLVLLQRQAGLDLVRTGGTGGVNTLFTRGSNSKHTLVLIDGLRANSTVQGIFDFAHLPLAEIERIEIVRGPRAALWGSDAIGGVIQIFTRDPTAAYVEARGGSYGSSGVDTGFGVSDHDVRFGFAVGSDHSRGFSATNKNNFSFNADDDGYDNTHGSFRFINQIGSQRFAATARIADAEVEFDQGVSHVRTQSIAANLQGELTKSWSHQLSVGVINDDNQTTSDFGDSSFGGQRVSLDWINSFAVSEHQSVQAGLNWSRDTGRASDNFYGEYFDKKRRDLGGFVAWSGRFSAHTLQLTLRHDDDSQFGGTSTGSAAWGWQLSDTLRLRASWGQGFHAPTLNDLYIPDVYGCCRGNPDLLPEHSNNQELGLDWQLSVGQHLAMSAYRNRINDLIELDDTYTQYINIAKAEIKGVELEYGARRGGFSFDGNATWQNPRDINRDEALLRRPKRKINLSAGYLFGNGLSFGLDASAFGTRPDFGGSTLQGYGRLDLRAGWQVNQAWSFEARVENLADRDYELVSGYNTPGRSGMVTVRWNAK